MVAKALVKAKTDESKTKHYLKLWLILLGAAIVFGLLGAVTGFFWILSTIAGIAALVFFILWLLSM
jgi:flagellar basal body-associated protein FliL